MLDTAGSDNANMKEGGELFAVLQKHPFGDQCVTRDFPDMAHGWTTRGDLKVPAVAAAVDKALSGGIQFLKKHLLGESTTVPTITLGTPAQVLLIGVRVSPHIVSSIKFGDGPLPALPA